MLYRIGWREGTGIYWDCAIPFRTVLWHCSTFRSILSPFCKRQNANAHTVQRSWYEEGGMSWLSSAQASDPDNRRTCAFMCFSILCMRSSAKLIPYGAVLNRCVYRAVNCQSIANGSTTVTYSDTDGRHLHLSVHDLYHVFT